MLGAAMFRGSPAPGPADLHPQKRCQKRAFRGIERPPACCRFMRCSFAGMRQVATKNDPRTVGTKVAGRLIFNWAIDVFGYSFG